MLMEKLTVGILGLRRGLSHLRNFLALPDVEVIGAADRLPEIREKAAAVIGERPVKLVSEFEELLRMKPDAVVIATNGKLQVEHTIIALQAGCHVLSEVPGAYTPEECVKLRDAVERSGLIYMFGENSCFLNHLRYWRKWILEDRFGPISLIEGEYVHYLPETLQAPDGTRMTPSEARAQGRSDVHPIWRADQPPIQYLTHDLGPALELIDDRCVNVVCKSSPWWNPETPLRPDGQIALFETAKGTLIRILITLSTKRPGDHNMRLFGIYGGAEIMTHEDYTRRFDRNRNEKDGWEKLHIPKIPQGIDIRSGHGGSDGSLAYHFTKTVLEGRPSPIDVYRMIDYTLPGIIAARSAELGGMPLSIPNLRREPYTTTRFWDAVGLPEDEPEAEPLNGNA
jgi:predicted dehydrogenase